MFERAKQLDALRECVYPRALERATRKADDQREHQDRRAHIIGRPLAKGQVVYKFAEVRTPKVGELWQGPFWIVEQVPGGMYRLANANGDILPQVYPLQKLKLKKELAPAEKIHEVERILEHEMTPEGRRFLVRWLGYKASSDSWVDEEDFTDDGASVDGYFAGTPVLRQRRSDAEDADGAAAAAP